MNVAVAAGPASEAGAYFESKVLPLLQKRCYECHSHEKKIKGGLALDSRSGWEHGGDNGPAIVPGDLEKSLLIKAVRYTDSDLQMPTKGKLPAEEIAILEAWVKQGAADPRATIAAGKKRGIDIEEGRKFWAFRPVVEPVPPAVKDASWPLDPADRFVLAKLEQASLRPVADADRYTWLRRVSLDLTGLPPTPEQVQAFIQSAIRDPQSAMETVVDRLLGSRGYGERWARHWLDLTGYADMMGTSNSVFAEHAWRYRDYLINAFNADKPFDEFVREQVAGDLMPAKTTADRAAKITATGFLMVGDIEIVNPDKAKMDADHIDSQMIKIGTAFMGMTLGCVRCHDHKFDPIGLEDYYGIAGMLRSSPASHKMPDMGVWSTLNSTVLPQTPAQLAARTKLEAEAQHRIASLKDEQKKLTDEKATVVTQLALVGDPTDSARPRMEIASVGSLNRRETNASEADVKCSDKSATDNAQRDVAKPGAATDSGQPQIEKPSAGLPESAGDPANKDALAKPAANPTKDAEDIKAISRGLREATPPDPRTEKTDPGRGRSEPVDKDALIKRRDALDAQIKKLEGDITHAEFFKDKTPRAFAMGDGPPADMPVYIRGNPYAPSTVVPRGAVRVASWDEFPAIPAGQSGRLQLADWLADERNPLTARVTVNRIWQKLFGTGIVPSVDYFGARGDVPTHPELLDHLATRFMQGGWSQKAFLRSLVLSRTYRLSSANETAAMKLDPENKLFWRMNRQRLDAEAMRDSLLAISGELTRNSGGPALVLENPENCGALALKGVNPPNYSHRKPRPSQEFERTIYQPVLRGGTAGPDRLRAFFDFVDPAMIAGQRNQTVVPTQSLFLLNNDLLRKRAANLAKGLTESISDHDARLAELWLRAFSRPISDAERDDAIAFLERLTPLLKERPDAESAAWQELCHGLLASNHFIYRL